MSLDSGKPPDMVISALMVLTVFFLCIATGPGTFDAMDGAEMAVAGLRLEIPHSPGYPLFMWLLRVSGGRSYRELRIVACLLSGLAAGAVYLALRSFGTGAAASSAASVLLVTSGPVLSQLNLLEVHGLSLLLASAAILFRRSRLGPYVFGMSVFGGHPLSVLLLPVLLNRRWLRHWFLGLIPATVWLYVPVRGAGSTVMHYGGPSGISGLMRYFGMYGNRIASPSLSGLGDLVAELGVAASIAFLVGIVHGRFKWKRYAAVAGVMLVFLCYHIPDVTSYSWLLLLPLSIQAAEGFQALMEKKRKTLWAIAVTGLLLLSAFFGIRAGIDRRNDAMQTIVSDILRGIPPGRVFCTTGGTSYYSAYMQEAEDRRPDLTAIDRGGMVFSFSLLLGPMNVIPPEIAGRYVHATGAWGSLPPSGIVFSIEERRLEWSSYDIFRKSMVTAEEMPGDMLAEIWCVRAFQEGSAASAAFDSAMGHARSETAAAAVEQMIRNHQRALNQ